MKVDFNIYLSWKVLWHELKFRILVLADYKLVISNSRFIYFTSMGRMASPLSIEITHVIFWLL